MFGQFSEPTPAISQANCQAVSGAAKQCANPDYDAISERQSLLAGNGGIAPEAGHPSHDRHTGESDSSHIEVATTNQKGRHGSGIYTHETG